MINAIFQTFAKTNHYRGKLIKISFNSVARKEGLNRIKSLIKRMVEIISENKYRIFIVIVMLGFIGLLIYTLFMMNNEKSFKELIGFIPNYLIILVGIYIIYQMSPLIKQIWKQTDIRDKIEEAQLENEKLRLEIKDYKRKQKLKEQRK